MQTKIKKIVGKEEKQLLFHKEAEILTHYSLQQNDLLVMV